MGRFIELIDDDEEFPVRIDGMDAVFYCRRLTRDQMKEITRRYQKVEWRNGARTVYVPEEKSAEIDRDILDHVIRRWSGVVGRDGSPVECTRETRSRLPSQVIVQLLAMTDETNISRLREEDARPNSSGSSSGA